MAEIDKYFVALAKHEGSDLHVSTGAPPFLRVHGTITALKAEPFKAEKVMAMWEEIMPEKSAQEYKDTGDADFAYELEGVARFRCNVFMDRKGPGGVSRIIPNDFLTADQLNIPQSESRSE